MGADDRGGSPWLRVGVSACLVGRRVRYDGGHKRVSQVADRLAAAATLEPVCPELEAGLGVPRPAVKLVREGGTLRVLGAAGLDVTAVLFDGVERLAGSLADLDGFVFKSRSPSCGLRDTPVYSPEGHSADVGRGVFAAAVARRFPLLPLADETELGDQNRRWQFVLRTQIHHHWRMLVAGGPAAGAELLEFHDRQRLLLAVYPCQDRRYLGRLAHAGNADAYGRSLARVLSRPMGVWGHVTLCRLAWRAIRRRSRRHSGAPVAETLCRLEGGQITLGHAVRILREAAQRDWPAFAGQSYLALTISEPIEQHSQPAFFPADRREGDEGPEGSRCTDGKATERHT